MSTTAKSAIRRITNDLRIGADAERSEAGQKWGRLWFKVRFATPRVAPTRMPQFAYVTSGMDASNIIYTALIEDEYTENACAEVVNCFDAPVFLRVEVDCKPEFTSDDAMMGASIRGVTQATKPRGLLSSIFLFWK